MTLGLLLYHLALVLLWNEYRLYLIRIFWKSVYFVLFLLIQKVWVKLQLNIFKITTVVNLLAWDYYLRLKYQIFQSRRVHAQSWGLVIKKYKIIILFERGCLRFMIISLKYNMYAIILSTHEYDNIVWLSVMRKCV
jgi:hypothetical protein